MSKRTGQRSLRTEQSTELKVGQMTSREKRKEEKPERFKTSSGDPERSAQRMGNLQNNLKVNFSSNREEKERDQLSKGKKFPDLEREQNPHQKRKRLLKQILPVRR